MLSATPWSPILSGFQINALRNCRNGSRSSGTLCEQSLHETIRRLDCLSPAEIQVLAKTSVSGLNTIIQADVSKAPNLADNIGLVYKALQSNKGVTAQSHLFKTAPSPPYMITARGFKTRRSAAAEVNEPFVSSSSSSNKDADKKSVETLNGILQQLNLPPQEKEKINLAVLAYAAGLKDQDQKEGGEKTGSKDAKKKFFEWGKINNLATILIIIACLVTLAQRFGFANFKFIGGINEIKPEEIEVTFADVRGCDEAKKELQDIVEFLVNPEKFSNLGGRLPKGCLLVGPPGTGKTLLARAVAGEAGVPFFHAAGSEFDEMFVGQGARRVRDLFKVAKMRAPCVLFIDEIDSVGAARTNSPHHPYANQTINQLLSEMDGFVSSEGVIVLGATNQVDKLDKALLRPGRFDTQVEVPKPDIKGRKEILTLYLSKIKHDDSIDIEKLAKLSIDFSGADIQNMVNTAAIKAAMDEKQFVTMAEFEYSHDKHVLGTDWKSRVRDKEDLKITAYHEAGHVLVSYFTPDSNPVHKVTIVAKGPSGGHTAFLPEKDQWHSSKSQLKARMDGAMGGRAAEELIFGKDKITGGASSDFQTATNIAVWMVKELGMSEKIGLRVVKEVREVAPGTSELMDIEITKLMNESYARASNILKTHRQELELLADALLKYETLDADDIKCIIETKRPMPPRPPVNHNPLINIPAPRIVYPEKSGLKPPVVKGTEVMS